MAPPPPPGGRPWWSRGPSVCVDWPAEQGRGSRPNGGIYVAQHFLSASTCRCADDSGLIAVRRSPDSASPVALRNGSASSFASAGHGVNGGAKRTMFRCLFGGTSGTLDVRWTRVRTLGGAGDQGSQRPRMCKRATKIPGHRGLSECPPARPSRFSQSRVRQDIGAGESGHLTNATPNPPGPCGRGRA